MTKKDLEGSDAEIAAFSEALAAALRPSDIDPDKHEEILARVLGLGDDEASADDAIASEPAADEAELKRSSLLASLLESDLSRVDGSNPELLRLALLARALRLAYEPTAIDDVAHQRVLGAGLKTPTRVAARRTVVGAVFVLVAAAAAIFGLYVQQPKTTPDPATAMRATPQAPLIEARTSTDLFDPMTPFDRSGGTTERVDKITTTRASELRDNQFTAWGVQ